MPGRAAPIDFSNHLSDQDNRARESLALQLDQAEREFAKNPNRPLSFFLREVTERVSTWAAADGAAIALSDAWGLICRASVGDAPDIGSRIPEHSLSRRCFETGETQIFETPVESHSHLSSNSRFSSLVEVPIRDGSRVLGIIGIFSSRPGAFSAVHIWGLEQATERLTPRLRTSATIKVTPEKSRAWIIAAVLLFVVVGVAIISDVFRSKSDQAIQNSPQASLSQPPVPHSTTQPSISPLNKSTVAQDTEAILKEKASTSETSKEPEQQILHESKTSSILEEVTEPSRILTPLTQPSFRSTTTETEARNIVPFIGSAQPLISIPSIPITKSAIPNVAIQEAPHFVQERVLKGHSNSVTSIAFNSDGNRFASGSWDETVKLWNVAGAANPSVIATKAKEIQALAFRSDGKFLAAENTNNTVTLWNVLTGEKLRVFESKRSLAPVGSSWVYSIAFSPDGRWLASGIDEKTVRIWDVESGEAIRDLSGERRAVIYIAFSPDGRWLATGDDDKTIRIWNVATGSVVQTLHGHKKTVYAVAFSPNRKWIASASADRTVKIWDITSGKEIQSLSGHRGDVTSITFSPDGHWLASGSWDKTIKLWDSQSGRELQTLEGNTDRVYTVAFDHRGNWLASGSEDGSIRLWHMSSQ